MRQEERADRVASFVEQYAGDWDRGEEAETVLTDLVAVLMHFADTYGVNPNGVIGRATMHYRAEETEDTVDDE